MKFMKLGSKPDLFQTEGDNIRYVASELATDVVVNVGDIKFYVHKFPLLSKSTKLQQLVSMADGEISDEIIIHDMPGGPSAFEVCAKFCYGMTVTLNPYNVVAARCAAEYLEMYESVEKGNLVYKIEVFLNSSILRSWKDSIIVLQTTKSLLPWSEELKLASHCLDSIASKVSIDVSQVEWSYTYNRKVSENGNDPPWNGVRRPQIVPKDWWVEDLCELPIDLYKKIIETIKAKGQTSAGLIGESLKAYVMRRFPDLNKGIIQGGDIDKSRSLIEAIICLLPVNEISVSCSFLLKLFQASILLHCGEMERRLLTRHIALQLEEATLADLLIRAPAEEPTIYNVDLIYDLVEEFLKRERPDSPEENESPEIKVPRFISNSSKLKVAKLVDGYLAEVSRDPYLPLTNFVDLAEKVSGFPRSDHDGLYRAIDMYLKEHPDVSKSDRKRICRLMDCRKLSADACMHAVQNDRLPMRVIVQVLFFEQMRTSTSSGGGGTPEIPGSIKTLLPGNSYGSSRSTTNTEEDWDSISNAEELRALKGELATLRLRNDGGKDAEKLTSNRVKGMLMSKKIFSKLWSNKDRQSDLSGSDTTGSPSSTQETKSTPSRSQRHSSS